MDRRSRWHALAPASVAAILQATAACSGKVGSTTAGGADGGTASGSGWSIGSGSGSGSASARSGSGSGSGPSSGGSSGVDSGSRDGAPSTTGSDSSSWSGSDSSDASGSSSGASGGATALSCAPGGDGLTNCGASSESCCASLEIAGGTFFRTYDPVGRDGGIQTATDGGPTGLADPASVSAFRLDKFLVTVGRFRQFVAAWDVGWRPAAQSGKHAHLNGGLGLANSASAGTYETGWRASDNGNIAPTSGNLACDSGTAYDTWTIAAGAQEKLPINCVNWYEAYAFCIWDGGFLPSEAEWEYAAAGGNQQREFPWGSADPGTANQYAIYGCYYPNGSCSGIASIAPVGTPLQGASRWGQLDMAGEVSEWNLDWYAPYTEPCTDCAYVTGPAFPSGCIGGSWFSAVSPFYMSPPSRDNYYATSRHNYIGFRCARTP